MSPPSPSPFPEYSSPLSPVSPSVHLPFPLPVFPLPPSDGMLKTLNLEKSSTGDVKPGGGGDMSSPDASWYAGERWGMCGKLVSRLQGDDAV